MIDAKGLLNWNDSKARIGTWKEAVSSAQRARKKMYWNRTGCVARNGEGTAAPKFVVVPFVMIALLLALAPAIDAEDESSWDEFEGVAFSMRAHVK
jgi:hypothetical protein